MGTPPKGSIRQVANHCLGECGVLLDQAQRQQQTPILSEDGPMARISSIIEDRHDEFSLAPKSESQAKLQQYGDKVV